MKKTMKMTQIEKQTDRQTDKEREKEEIHCDNNKILRDEGDKDDSTEDDGCDK